MLLEIRRSCRVVNNVLWNWSSVKRHKFYKNVSMIESLLSKTLSLHACNCNSDDTLTGVFLWRYSCKKNFRCFISHKYAFTDVLQNRCSWNFLKTYRKKPCTRLSLLQQRCFSDYFLKSLVTSFLQNISERLLLTSIQSSYYFKTLLFQNRSIFV